MAHSPRSNRWLGQYAATLGGDDQRILAQAMDTRKEHTQAKIKAGANPIHLAGPWGEFADFHNVRKIEEGLKGNKYGVGAISGGGDINQRALSGDGPTTEIFSPGRAMATGSGTIVPARTRGTAMLPAAARPTTNMADDAPTWLMRLREDAEAAGLRDQMHSANTAGRLRQQSMTDRALAALDTSKRGVGTQGGRDFVMGQAADKRQIASDDSWQQAGDRSGQFWQYQEPRDRLEHQQNMEIADVRADPARIAAESRLIVQRMIQDGRIDRTQADLLMSLMSNTRQGEAANVGYNQPRADQLGSAFDALSQTAQGQIGAGPGAGGGPGPRGGGPGPAGLPSAASPTGTMGPRNPRIPPGTPSQQGPDGMYYLNPETGQYEHEDDFGV